MKYTGISVFSKSAIEITVEDARIVNIQQIPSDPALPYISPGFLDMQCEWLSGQ